MTSAHANVSLEEVDKFERLAQNWWDIRGPLKSLHDINPLRFSFIKQYTALTQQTVLDVGCGGGILTEAIAKEGAIATGIDLAQESIEVAKVHAKQSKLKIDYYCEDVEQYAVEKAQFYDVLTCMELLEHVPEPIRLVNACAQLLKPGGILLMSTINRNVQSYLQAIVAAEYVLKIVPKNTHDYSKFIKPSDLTRMARTQQLELLGMSGFSYQPVTKQYYLTPNVTVNYLIAFQKKA